MSLTEKKLLLLFWTSIFTISLGYSQQKYFQQKVDYKIEVKLDTLNKILNANETITYTNNSPDTLHYIYFHLWANGYKNKHTQLSQQLAHRLNGKIYFNASKYGGWIDSLDFSSKGKKLKWQYDKKNPDICIVYLNKPLFPRQSVEISTPFKVKIPTTISRMCHQDGFYSITQWYPKPAVYDQYGWHPMPYLDQGEFYSEFGSFAVFITVPKQMVVASTGNLNNAQELQWLENLAKYNVDGTQIENPCTNQYKTLHYSDSLIHDFAWFAYEKFFVEIDSLYTPRTQKLVRTWSFYTSQNKFYWQQQAVKYVNKAVEYYSLMLGDYPYNNCAAVDGPLNAGGGMEYPQITIVSVKSDPQNVIVHEVGHNWLYGILAFNERRFPFLDEGINSYYDNRYSKELNYQQFYLSVLPKDSQKALDILPYSMIVMLGKDQPLDLHSTQYSYLNYGLVVYQKASLVFNYAEKTLGKQKFDSTMQIFYQKWKFKHPHPQDLQQVFYQSFGQNSNWILEDYAKTDKYTDYSIKYKNNKLIVSNKGKITAPTIVAAYKNDTICDTFVIFPDKKTNRYNFDNKNYKHFIIDPDFETLDLNRYNNFTKTKGIFRKFQKFKIKPSFYAANLYDKTLLFLPFPFYDKISKFQIEAIISNFKIPLNKFKFILMPIYSFGNKKLEGYYYAEYQTIGYSALPDIIYSLSIDRYPIFTTLGYTNVEPFRKLKAQIALNLRNTTNLSKYANKLNLALYVISSKSIISSKFADDRYNYTTIFNINYKCYKNSLFKYFSFDFNTDIYSNNQVVIWAAAQKHLHYLSVFDGLDVRLFAGFNTPIFGTTGSYNFKINEFYLSRYSDQNFPFNLLSHQFNDNYGGFVHFGQFETKPILFSVNLKSTLPKIPIFKIFANIAADAKFIDQTGLKQIQFNQTQYEAGIMLDFFKNFISIYLPFWGSEYVTELSDTYELNWYQKIRFTFKLEEYRNLNFNF